MVSEKERLAIIETKLDTINEKVKWLEVKGFSVGLAGGLIQRYAPDILQTVSIAFEHLKSFV